MIVLDTHIWVNWILGGYGILPATVVAAMKRESRWAVSSISCFEVSLLVKRGRLELPLPVEQWLQEATVHSMIESLPVTCEIAQRATSLADIHRDPADRMIIATALIHDALLASKDSLFSGYPELAGRLIC